VIVSSKSASTERMLARAGSTSRSTEITRGLVTRL
jgi:hypothetical protein